MTSYREKHKNDFEWYMLLGCCVLGSITSCDLIKKDIIKRGYNTDYRYDTNSNQYYSRYSTNLHKIYQVRK